MKCPQCGHGMTAGESFSRDAYEKEFKKLQQLRAGAEKEALHLRTIINLMVASKAITEHQVASYKAVVEEFSQKKGTL